MKIRIRFRKLGVMRFIGHLDVMRYFQKAIRRADIDIAYSEGYSPHQIMSFALPLGVGVTSDGEYLDIQMNSEIKSKEAIDRLNCVMAEGIEITDFIKLPDDAKKSMAIVGAASYVVTWKDKSIMPFNKEQIVLLRDSFLSREEINIVKKTKKSEKQVNIKPMIYKLNINCDDKLSNLSVEMITSAGSENNLKPELVIESMYNFLNIEFDINKISIHRRELLTSDLIPLKDLGEIIE